MNKVQLTGTVGNVKALPMKDATKHGARFTVSIPWTKGEGRDVLPVVAWDSAATAALALDDGAEVSISARLSRRNWDDNGTKRWETTVTALSVSPAHSTATAGDDFPF